MKKPHSELKRVGSSLLRTLSGPLRDILSTINAPAGFFLSLNPDQFELRFLGIHSAKPNPTSAKVLRDYLDQQPWPSDLVSGGDPQTALFHIIARMREQSGLSWSDIQGAAVSWLETGSIKLGNLASSLNKEPLSVEHWSVTNQNRPLLRFQDTLDWAAKYGFDLDRLKNTRGDTTSYEELSPTVLKIPTPAVRTNLVVRENLHIFLAEHIISLDGSIDSSNSFSPEDNWSHTFYMFPIRGLGQWRAAINWIEARHGEVSNDSKLAIEIQKQASTLARAAIEEMFSLSLINDFALSVEECFTIGGPTLNARKEKLTTAFARLWWAKKIRFYKNGNSVDRLDRNSTGALEKPVSWVADQTRKWNPVNNGSYPKFFLWSQEPDSSIIYLRLLLHELVGQREDETANLNLNWHFDEIVYECDLFQADEKELQRLSDLLGQRLLKIIIEQVVQAKVIKSERAEVYEGCAHWIKDAIGITGWQDSLQSLTDLPSGHKENSFQIRKAENSLSLFSILDGAASLLRLSGILDRKDYQKLKHWFDEESLAEWWNESAFEIYQNSIIHLARSIGSALGRPLVNVSVNGESRLYDGDCKFSPYLLRFPPLSKALTDEPIFALLPGFLEPLINALRFLRNSRQLTELQRREEPVQLRFEDHRMNDSPVDPAHILVSVGNVYPIDQQVLEEAGDLMRLTEHLDPTGVKTTRLFVARTFLATIKKTEFVEGYRWTPVLFHPQELHRKIFEES